MNKEVVLIFIVCSVAFPDFSLCSETDRARQALEYVAYVQNNPCTGGTGEVLPVSFDHAAWAEHARVAVRMANILTQIAVRNNNTFTSLDDVFLFDLVINNVNDYDSPIFGSAIAVEEYVYPKYRTFCPYAYRKDMVYSHDISLNYDYLNNGTEWYASLRYKDWKRAFTTNTKVKFRENDTHHGEVLVRDSPVAQLSDGHWTYPYYDCGGGDIWMVTYSAPIFGMHHGHPIFIGIGTIDIELTDIDINQCDTDYQTDGQALDVFRGTHSCQPTTKCVPIRGEGFVRGAYNCCCDDGFYFPQLKAKQKYFKGKQLENKYALDLNMSARTDTVEGHDTYRCLPCAPGCDTCVDDSPCLYTESVFMDVFLCIALSVQLCLVFALSGVVIFFKHKKVIKSASPIFMHAMNLGAGLMYLRMFLEFPELNEVLCLIRLWPHHIGFVFAYGALLIKTWRISAIFNVKSAKRLNLNDRAVLNRFIPLVFIALGYMTAWTSIGRPMVTWQKTENELKYKECTISWWDYGALTGEACFLLWGAYLSFVVRKAPSNFNESKYITWSIYNAILLGGVILILRETIARNMGPDVIMLVNFIYLQVTVTAMLCLVYAPKVYAIMKGTSDMGSDTTYGVKPNTVSAVGQRVSSKAVQVNMTQVLSMDQCDC